MEHEVLAANEPTEHNHMLGVLPVPPAEAEGQCHYITA